MKKTILLMSLLFSVLTVSAGAEEVSCAFMNLNYDGTTTISLPRVLRGSKTYHLTTTRETVDGICKRYGFDSFLEPDAETHKFDEQKYMASFDVEGRFSGIELADYTIVYITCEGEKNDSLKYCKYKD